MSESLHRRVEQIRARAKVRAWTYRQRQHAKGVWDRLRRILADARIAYAISEKDAAMLQARGIVPEPVGLELEPSKTILFVSPAQLATISDKQELAVRLNAEFLQARYIALERFVL